MSQLNELFYFNCEFKHVVTNIGLGYDMEYSICLITWCCWNHWNTQIHVNNCHKNGNDTVNVLCKVIGKNVMKKSRCMLSVSMYVSSCQLWWITYYQKRKNTTLWESDISLIWRKETCVSEYLTEIESVWLYFQVMWMKLFEVCHNAGLLGLNVLEQNICNYANGKTTHWKYMWMVYAKFYCFKPVLCWMYGPQTDWIFTLGHTCNTFANWLMAVNFNLLQDVKVWYIWQPYIFIVPGYQAFFVPLIICVICHSVH